MDKKEQELRIRFVIGKQELSKLQETSQKLSRLQDQLAQLVKQKKNILNGQEKSETTIQSPLYLCFLLRVTGEVYRCEETSSPQTARVEVEMVYPSNGLQTIFNIHVPLENLTKDVFSHLFAEGNVLFVEDLEFAVSPEGLSEDYLMAQFLMRSSRTKSIFFFLVSLN